MSSAIFFGCRPLTRPPARRPVRRMVLARMTAFRIAASRSRLSAGFPCGDWRKWGSFASSAGLAWGPGRPCLFRDGKEAIVAAEPIRVNQRADSSPIDPSGGERNRRLSSKWPSAAMSKVERVRLVRQTMWSEADAIDRAADIAGPAAADAAERIAACRGCVVITGVGKAGLIAQKLVATFASTGSPAHFLHPSEAMHGDLGRVRADDLVIALSNSGRSEEVLRVAPLLRDQASGLIALTADNANPLSEFADLVVPIGKHAEACPNGLAPTSTTTVMLAVGDAMAVLASRLRGFSREDFGRFHPGGALGRKLTRVDQIMRPLTQCRIAEDTISVREAIRVSGGPRRCGAVMLVDRQSRTLSGIFTDSDLARLLQSRREANLDDCIGEHMTRSPIFLTSGAPLGEAVDCLSSRRISELPVVDAERRPIGMIDVTDLIAAGDLSPAAVSDGPIHGSQHGRPRDPVSVVPAEDSGERVGDLVVPFRPRHRSQRETTSED